VSIAIDASSLPEVALRRALHDRQFWPFRSLNATAFLGPCHEGVFHFGLGGRAPIAPLAIGVCYVCKDQPARFGHHRDKHCRGTVWHIPYETVQSAAADGDHHPAYAVWETGAQILRTLQYSCGAYDIAPSVESGIAGDTVRVSRMAMTTKLKVVVDTDGHTVDMIDASKKKAAEVTKEFLMSDTE
jgi:hypothetical protein